MFNCIKSSQQVWKTIMSKSPSKLLALQKRSRCDSKKSIVKIEPDADSMPNTSPYFSPKRTRNTIKIEYEKPVIKTETRSARHQPQPLRLDLLKPKKALPDVVKMEKNTSKRKSDDKKSAIIHQSGAANQEDLLLVSTSKQMKWMPPKWQQTLENIKAMREKYPAPVDTMGCHKCYDPYADEKTKRFHILVSLMLSSQTKDNVTYEAMLRLRANGLTPTSLVQCEQAALEKLLYPVSFYKNKAKYLQKTSQILIDEYDSDIPKTIGALIKLPGVGPKMGHICMYAAWKTVSGIGVDTHVHRITNRLKWTQKPTADPEKTRIGLEQWLPLDLWPEINPLLVGFGQTICTPTHPKCQQCVNADICPSRGCKQ